MGTESVPRITPKVQHGIGIRENDWSAYSAFNFLTLREELGFQNSFLNENPITIHFPPPRSEAGLLWVPRKPTWSIQLLRDPRFCWNAQLCGLNAGSRGLQPEALPRCSSTWRVYPLKSRRSGKTHQMWWNSGTSGFLITEKQIQICTYVCVYFSFWNTIPFVDRAKTFPSFHQDNCNFPVLSNKSARK